jgi:para-aminobenzoate synthetase component 1
MDPQLTDALARIGLSSLASGSQPRVVAEPIEVTPLEAARRLAERPRLALLDSSLAGGRMGRWSYLGIDPFLVVQARGRRVELRAGTACAALEGEPFALLGQLMRALGVPELPGLPPFVGGAIGYFGYDLGRLLERLPSRLSADPDLPDLDLGFFDRVIAWDHVEERGWLIGLEVDGSRGSLRDLRAEIEGSHPAEPTAGDDLGELEFRSNVSRADYLAMVRRVLEEIAAGEVYQVNVSQRLEATWRGTAWEAYERLRAASPVPFGAFLQLDADTAILSASPERYLRLDGQRVETRPMKGTRPRGRTAAEDERLAADLGGSPKDRAENAMIVDVLRNDLGRVCRTDSVAAEELCAVEPSATVWQMVSTVVGELRAGLGAVELLRACFPGGSISGAPKIRAMELIEELETVRRGVYCGAIGYLSATGAMDTSVAIRTLVLDGQRLLLSVGGGIVADSDPEAEYEESLVKARAALTAFDGHLA